MRNLIPSQKPLSLRFTRHADRTDGLRDTLSTDFASNPSRAGRGRQTYRLVSRQPSHSVCKRPRPEGCPGWLLPRADAWRRPYFQPGHPPLRYAPDLSPTARISHFAGQPNRRRANSALERCFRTLICSYPAPISPAPVISWLRTDVALFRSAQTCLSAKFSWRRFLQRENPPVKFAPAPFGCSKS